ncbi:MAG TPA: TetR/AcrR family transcriptional regulator [Steroidobacter sp.]
MPTRRNVALSRKDLYQRVWSEPLRIVAKELGLTGSALAKICDRLLVPYPPRGYWMKFNAGKALVRASLPAAPEANARQVRISSKPASSRRARTRLDPSARRDQLLDLAIDLIGQSGLHAASLKQLAAVAGISETQVYNYFRTRETLFVEIAKREFARIERARHAGIAKAQDHYSQVTLATRTYLREIGERGALLQMLLSSPDVRNRLEKERGPERAQNAAVHARYLTDRYSVAPELALACTVVLSRLCVRTGQLIADKKLSLEAAERMCLSMVLRGSRAVLSGEGVEPLRGAQGPKAA